MPAPRPTAVRLQVLALLSAALLMVLPGCSRSESEAAISASSDPRSALPLPTITPEVRDERGMIVSSVTDLNLSPPLIGAGATQYTVVYRSVSGIDGTQRDVSGKIFVPPGTPPSGGWPVIAYGHGTTGITNDCGPSGYPDLLGSDLVVASLLKLGFVVSLTDYEGLGHSGLHPFLEPRTAAFNMIDSVRAARELVPDVSTRWLAVGVSQGGQASWAANELAGEYGDGLQLFGSASQTPYADLQHPGACGIGLADQASAGAVTDGGLWIAVYASKHQSRRLSARCPGPQEGHVVGLHRSACRRCDNRRVGN